MENSTIEKENETASQTLTMDSIRECLNRCRKSVPIANPMIHMMGLSNYLYLKYLAIKYPNGATLIRKRDKQKTKKRTSKKRFKKLTYIDPMRIIMYEGKEAILYHGIYCMPILPSIEYAPIGLEESKEYLGRGETRSIKFQAKYILKP